MKRSLLTLLFSGMALISIQSTQANNPFAQVVGGAMFAGGAYYGYKYALVSCFMLLADRLNNGQPIKADENRRQAAPSCREFASAIVSGISVSLACATGLYALAGGAIALAGGTIFYWGCRS